MRILLLLLFFFSLAAAGCAGQRELAERQDLLQIRAEQLDSLRAVRTELEAEIHSLRDSLQFYEGIDTGQYYREQRTLQDKIVKLQYDAIVAREGGLTVATIQVDDFFEPASATLTEQGQTLLDRLAEKLQDHFGGRQFRVEGYSDSVPVGPGLAERFPSNWELSAARAAAVVRYLTSAHGLESERFEVVSYGATRPTAPNTTAAGRRLNRRIRVAVLPEAEENL